MRLISFNPRVLAGGRDHKVILCYEKCNVSIHASSREDATVFSGLRRAPALFQSTRPRGRTRLIILRLVFRGLSFNPRVLAGGRDQIQAPEGGWQYGFNPRVLAGGRDYMILSKS